MRLSVSVCFAVFFAFTVLFIGCSTAPSVSPGVVYDAHISGRVHGGQQPVSGAIIKLYTVGTSADGSASTSLLSQTVTTDANGDFTITNLYSCTNATLVYSCLQTSGVPRRTAACSGRVS